MMPGYTIGILAQEPALDDGKTVFDNVAAGLAATRALLERYEEVTGQLAGDCSDELLEELGGLAEQLDHLDAWDLDSRIDQAMDALRCPAPEEDVSVLSGGERRRVALCRLLLAQPDLLLLDEPTTTWTLRASPGWSSTWTNTRVPWSRSPTTGISWPTWRAGSWNSTAAAPTRTRGTTDLPGDQGGPDHGRGPAGRQVGRRLQDPLAWVRSSPQARQAKGRARLEQYEQMAAAAASRQKLDFEEIQIPPGPRLGQLVIEAERLGKGFGGSPLIDGLSFTLPPNGIVGVIGPNGVGKTTMLKMILGEEKPDAGTIRVGDSVRISYVDQTRARIEPDQTVWEVISGGEAFIRAGRTEIPSRAYVAAFGFKGSDQQRPAGLASGGERGRMNLALTLKQGGNLLLLDEPANDLDVETLAALERALGEFPGCAVITSHDRWFLDRVATHILAWEGGADWFWFEGNFAAYEENKAALLDDTASRPDRRAIASEPMTAGNDHG